MADLLVILLLLGGEVSSMRCGDLLVLPGANKLDVISRCGEPQWRERVSGADAESEEVWIYAWPEKDSQKLLRFEGVTLVSIHDAGNATKGADLDTLRCEDGLIHSGATKLAVLERCGEPEIIEPATGEEGPAREVWLYDRDGASAELHFRGVQLERIVVRAR